MDKSVSFIKIVYFDEESASDYLDISAGGKAASTSEHVKERTKNVQARVETTVAAKLSWLPFIGASAETGAGVDLSGAGRSLLSKTLSNTILTDYLVQVAGDDRIKQLNRLDVTAPKSSMAYMKMFTPYMVIARTEDQGIDLARLDEALAAAKGYYELLGTSDAGGKCILRFNIRAFRNNYGLTDLGRMHLVFHGVLVGKTSESDLSFEAEMARESDDDSMTALDLVDQDSRNAEEMLDVYDVVLAGVENVS